MAPTVAHPMGKVTLYATDGTAVECHTIDAREMLAVGGWSVTPPGTAPAVTVLAPKPPPEAAPIRAVTAADAAPVEDKAPVRRKGKGN